MTINKHYAAMFLLFATVAPVWAIPAFPGAEGAGANALGGRGGDVYYVTTLANSGPGSLRDGISTAPVGGRTICFKVSGNIELNSTLNLNKSRITIAGQTAPGDGICLQDYALNILADDVVVRHLRSRLGTNKLAEADAIWVHAGNNIILDHCSTSWSVDETCSITRQVTNFTLQWCYITESLNNSIHSKGAHGYGGIISSELNSTYSVHHNLYAHHNSRNPRLGSEDGAVFRLDFRNNVIYNWGNRAGYSGGSTEFAEMNYVANYLVAGPDKAYNYAFLSGATTTAIYQLDNRIDLSLNGLVDGVDSGWGMFSGSYTATVTPFGVPAVPTDSAAVAYQRVLAQAGAMPWRRDGADVRVANTVRTLTGQIIDDTSQVGGWPTLNSETPPTDTDNDGIPDYWETALGWNPGVPNNNHLNPDGYTDLESYLNWLADPHAACDRNGVVDVNLRGVNGGAMNLTFSVANGTNGTVTLLGDGYTARFSPVAHYSGLADFTFNANDPVNSVGFGPVTLGVLVTANEALPVPGVTLTHPTDGSMLVAGVEVLLTADVAGGAGAVTNVQFYAGDSEPLPLISENQDAPYRQPWTPPSLPGAYTIRAVAEEDTGLNASNSIIVTVNLPVNTISTAVGNGADIEMQERSDGGVTNFTQNAVNGSALNTRTGSNGDRNDVIGLRFDLSGCTLTELTNVTLNLTAYRPDTSTRVVNLYGVAQGTAGWTGSYTTETWSDTALDSSNLFGDLPGLLETDTNPATQSLNTGALTFLEEITLPGSSVPEGSIVTFDDTAITSFIQNYSGSDQVTFVLAAGNGSSGQWRIASKEAGSLTTIVGSPGDFAPYLEFTTSSVTVPSLTYTITGGGTGIDFSWTGSGFRLQSQTNSLGTGLTTNWVDYQGGGTSPVSVPVPRTNGAVFYRLVQ